MFLGGHAQVNIITGMKYFQFIRRKALSMWISESATVINTFPPYEGNSTSSMELKTARTAKGKRTPRSASFGRVFLKSEHSHLLSIREPRWRRCLWSARGEVMSGADALSHVAGVLTPHLSPPPRLSHTHHHRQCGQDAGLQTKRVWLQTWVNAAWSGPTMDIYVPLGFLISFPFCNQSVQKHHSSSLRHSVPCARRAMVCARWGERAPWRWFILLSATPPVVEGVAWA